MSAVAYAIVKRGMLNAAGDSSAFSVVTAVQGKAVLNNVNGLALKIGDKVGVTSPVYNGVFTVWYIYQNADMASKNNQNVYIETPFVSTSSGTVVANPPETKSAIVEAPVTVTTNQQAQTQTVTVPPVVTDSGSVAAKIISTDQVIVPKVIQPLTIDEKTVNPIITESQAVAAPVLIKTTEIPVQQSDGSVKAGTQVIQPVVTNAGEVIKPTIVEDKVISYDIHEPVKSSDGQVLTSALNADGSVIAVDSIITPSEGTKPITNPDGSITVQTDGITIGSVKMPKWLVITGAILLGLVLIGIIKK